MRKLLREHIDEVVVAIFVLFGIVLVVAARTGFLANLGYALIIAMLTGFVIGRLKQEKIEELPLMPWPELLEQE